MSRLAKYDEGIMRWSGALAVMAWLYVGTAVAEPMAARGFGTFSCAEFAKHYKADPKFFGALYTAWAQGFMSGRDFELISKNNTYRDLNAISPEEADQYIRQYCDAHPLESFLQAASSLFATLPLKQVPK
jgi:hypothetical protein